MFAGLLESSTEDLASLAELISTRKESSAWEISGLRDATVSDRCLARAGKKRWIRCSHVNTIMFSIVEEISSSAVTFSQCCRIPPLALSKLSSMKLTSLW